MTIQKKQKSLTQKLTPKKATEPSQRRVIFQRMKDAPQDVNLQDLLLTINLVIKNMGLPEHIRFMKLSYTVNGAISGLLSEKAIASMLIPTFSETLIKVARQYDQATIDVEQAEQ